VKFLPKTRQRLGEWVRTPKLEERRRAAPEGAALRIAGLSSCGLAERFHSRAQYQVNKHQSLARTYSTECAAARRGRLLQRSAFTRSSVVSPLFHSMSGY
jgi:hypothetical protein